MAFLSIFLVLTFLALGHNTRGGTSEDDHASAVSQIFSLLKINETTLSLQQTDYIIAELWERVDCHSQSCQCLNVNTLFSLLGADPDSGLSKADLEMAAPVLLYFIHDITESCNAKLTNYTVGNFTNWLQVDENNGDGHSKEESEGDHNHEEEGHDEAKAHSEEVEHSVEENGHSNEEMGFRERLQGILNDLRKNYTRRALGESHKNDDHDNETPKKGDQTEEEEEEDHHEDKLGHSEENHTKEDQPHSHDNHMMEENKCIDAYTLVKTAGIESHEISNTQIQQVASFIILYVLKGYRIERHCSPLPYVGELTESLFSTLGARGDEPLSKTQFEQLLNSLKIGTVLSDEGQSETHDSHEESDDDGHGHRRRRAVMETVKDNTANNQPSPSDVLQQCLSAADLSSIYGFNLTGGISRSTLEMLSPALVQQQVTGACIPEEKREVESSKKLPTHAEVYGYGFIAVSIICLCALIGLILLPCASSAVFQDVMAIFIGLAVGTLITDAFIHLIPQGYGLHGHGDGDEHGHGDEVVLEPYMIKSLGILAAMYFFFVFESLMGIFTSSGGSHNTHGHSHMLDVKKTDKEANYTVTESSLQENKPCEIDHIQMTDDKKMGCCGNIKPVVLMIIMGDAVHNFADGLAIGAAFTIGVPGGIATSIAVLCHELPHELGDFAVLIKSGLSFKCAALFNLLSALTAFIGLFIGASLSTDAEVRGWIFLLSGGMFLYIALVEMVPDMVTSQLSGKTICQRFRFFFLQNIGVLIGVALLIVIALYEEKIRI